MYRPNPRLIGFECLRCAASLPIEDHARGCPHCLAKGFPASVAPFYDGRPAALGDAAKNRLPRFAERLPYLTFPTLGEGDTPLIALPRLARELNLEALYLKNEGAQPTGSHKDRMSALFVARAAASGAPAVVAASSGNAGVSLAAYAAVAGLPCTIATTPSMNPIWRRAIEMMGAIIVETGDSLSRWRYVKERVEQDGWASATNFLDPPVGSHPFGVDGYKTIAFELAEELGADGVDTVIIPTARGDVLWGIYAGFRELLQEQRIDRMPRLIAAEPFPRLERVLAGEDYRFHFTGQTALVSIGGTTATFQSVAALRGSAGCAISVASEDVRADQNVLAHDGLYLENSSAAPLSALRKFLASERGATRRVVLIATSHGFKEPRAAIDPNARAPHA